MQCELEACDQNLPIILSQSTMAKGKPKRAVVPNVKIKTAIGTAALLASEASATARGLRESGAGIGDEEAAVA